MIKYEFSKWFEMIKIFQTKHNLQMYYYYRFNDVE